MRLSSEMFPFASHGEYGYSLEYADKELKAAGELANKYGHRITSHPGQVRVLFVLYLVYHTKADTFWSTYSVHSAWKSTQGRRR